MPPGRITQRDIARMAGVSQATVSLVLTGRADDGRIPAETRDRVARVIRETGYVADPVAQSLVRGRNRILGVFTYEPVFPSAQADFFMPFLLGIEEGAQAEGYDLLLLTAGTAAGERRIFHEKNRLRLADGCLILGREFDRGELARLVAGTYPFVAVGRRDDAGGPVPYVGADYVTPTAMLAERARALGHVRIAYVGPSEGAESTVDRWRGFRRGLGGLAVAAHVPVAGRPAAEILAALTGADATVAFFTELADAVRADEAARAAGLSIPRDLSLIALGSHERPLPTSRRFTSLDVPREAMGRQAVTLLAALVEGRPAERQVLLHCDPVEGETLGPVLEAVR